MQRIMLRAKIKRATATPCNPTYQGSCRIAADLPDAPATRE